MAGKEKELCYLSRAKEYFLVSLSLTRQALSRPFLAAIRKAGGVLLFSPFKLSFLCWKWMWAKMSSQLMWKSLPNVFK